MPARFVDFEMRTWIHDRINSAVMIEAADIAELVSSGRGFPARAVVLIILLADLGEIQWTTQPPGALPCVMSGDRADQRQAVRRESPRARAFRSAGVASRAKKGSAKRRPARSEGHPVRASLALVQPSIGRVRLWTFPSRNGRSEL